MCTDSGFSSFSHELLNTVTEVLVWLCRRNELIPRWTKPHDKFLENLALVLPCLLILLEIPLLVVIEIWCVLIVGRSFNDFVFSQVIAELALFVLFNLAAI